MKWLFRIFSFYMKHFIGVSGEKAHPMEELKEFLRENGLKLFVGSVLIITLGTLFTAGIVISVSNLTSQFDLGLSPRFTATMAGGLIMAGVCLVVLMFAYYKSSPHHEKAPRRGHGKAREATPLEEAMLLLVNDFVKEREAKREARYYQTEAPMTEEQMNANPESEGFQRH